jgi:hypothetical protein
MFFRRKPTGVRHDFTDQHWGHALHLDHVKSVRKRILFGSLHHFRPVHRGDELMWVGSDGKHRVIARVLQSEGAPTVRDMYFVTVRIVAWEPLS